MANWSKRDTTTDMLFRKDRPLASRSDSLKTFLESVGFPLLSSKISSDLPFGWKSNIDLLKRELDLQKQIRKDLKFDINIKPRNIKATLTKDIY